MATAAFLRCIVIWNCLKLFEIVDLFLLRLLLLRRLYWLFWLEIFKSFNWLLYLRLAFTFAIQWLLLLCHCKVLVVWDFICILIHQFLFQRFISFLLFLCAAFLQFLAFLSNFCFRRGWTFAARHLFKIILFDVISILFNLLLWFCWLCMS